jgi:hypothetical protein
MFAWVWKIAHPTLHGMKTIQRLRTCATDGEANLYQSFKALCGEGQVYPNAS